MRCAGKLSSDVSFASSRFGKLTFLKSLAAQGTTELHHLSLFTNDCLYLLHKSNNMSQIETLIDPTTVQGTGSNLYAVIMVDLDDSEDTSIQLWKADSEDHLYDQVSEEFYDGEDPDDFMGPNFEEEIWGLVYLPKYIGQIK
jgi:hypothetical protein